MVDSVKDVLSFEMQYDPLDLAPDDIREAYGRLSEALEHGHVEIRYGQEFHYSNKRHYKSLRDRLKLDGWDLEVDFSMFRYDGATRLRLKPRRPLLQKLIYRLRSLL